MIIRVIETPPRSKFSRHFEPANELARIAVSLTRRPLLDDQDLVYLRKLGLESEVVTQRE